MANEKDPTTVTTVLNNIHYILGHVYHEAYREKHWTESNLKVALSWASYCEKIYNSILNKPAEEQLNIYIKEMVSRIPNSCVKNADLYFLKHSTKTLLILLLQNSDMDFVEYAYILDGYASYGLENQSSLEIPLYIIKGANPLLEALGVGDSQTFTFDQWLLLGSGFLLHNLMKRISKTSTSRTSESNLRNDFDELRRNKTRLLFLLMAANEAKLCLFQSMCYKLQHYIRKWCIDEMDKAKNTRSATETFLDMIVKQPASLLTDLALLDQQFLQEYIKALIFHGEKFEPQYQNSGYCWRNCVNSVQFTILVDHFNCLLTRDKKVTSIVKEILKELAESCCGSFWNDVYNECLIKQEWSNKKS